MIELTAAQIAALYAMRKAAPRLVVDDTPPSSDDDAVFVRAAPARGQVGEPHTVRIWRIDSDGYTQRVPVLVAPPRMI